VIFQSLPSLVASVRQFNSTLETFDCSVFTGEYVTGGVDATYLDDLESLRSENAKLKASGTVGEPAGGELVACSGPMNGADAAGSGAVIGLANSNPSADHIGRDEGVGLSNSIHE
jgi:amidophosphoribosyltransferase